MTNRNTDSRSGAGRVVHTADSPSTEDANARSRRRVCNLLPWEIEKKRAIDRANQQHFRRKKRQYIAELEAEVARLKAGLDAAETKLKCYERQSTPRRAKRPSPTSPSSSPASSVSAQPQPGPERSHTSQPEGSFQLDILDSTQSFSLFDQSLGDVNVVDDVLEIQRSPQSQPQPQPQPSPLSTHFPYMPYYLAGRQSRGDAATIGSLPDWMVLPLNLPVATELDKLVLVTSQALVQRYSTRELTQSVFPSVENLLACIQTDVRRQKVYSEHDDCHGDIGDNNHPILAAVASHVVWISPLKQLTARLAFLYKVALFLRWALCPSPATYNAMPLFLRPTPLQRRVPHPVWIDMIVWPDVRDWMIRAGDFGRFELFRSVTGQSMTVNWPYTDSGTFVEMGDSSSDVEGPRQALNPIFEAHIRNPENYSVGRLAAEAFPVLGKYVR